MPEEPTYEQIKPRTRRLGRVLAHLESTTSTMDEARRAAEAGEGEGFVVVADRQTAGRGRRDRTWFSPEGNLNATVLLRPAVAADRATWIPLVAGVAMSEAIERLIDRPARVKWPNDVLLADRKVAGILTESRWDDDGRLAWVLVGAGVNGNVRRDGFPEELRASATSLSAEAGRRVCLPALLKVFLERFEATLKPLEDVGSDPAGLVAPRLATLGRRVRITMPEGPVEGEAVRLGPRGELVLATDAGERAVDVGDCQHLRPA